MQASLQYDSQIRNVTCQTFEAIRQGFSVGKGGHDLCLPAGVVDWLAGEDVLGCSFASILPVPEYREEAT